MAFLRFLPDLLRPPAARHRYGPGRSQRVDLHLPPGPGPHPVAILLHGGSWLADARYRKWLMRPLAADLTRRGWAAWNVEYRGVGRGPGRGGGWPQTFEDVAAAVDLLAEVRDDRLDLDRVLVVGHSAGGQLALWAARRPSAAPEAPGGPPRVQVSRAVALAGVLVMGKPARSEPTGAICTFLGGGPDDVPERYAEADPIGRVPLGVPTLLVHGEADDTIPLKRSREYEAAAQAAGDDVKLVAIPGADHRDPIDPRGDCWRAVLEWL